MIVAALVGMAGAGKSEAARLFMNNGFIRIRFGDITDEEIKKRGLVLNEENERSVREGHPPCNRSCIQPHYHQSQAVELKRKGIISTERNMIH